MSTASSEPRTLRIWRVVLEVSRCSVRDDELARLSVGALQELAVGQQVACLRPFAVDTESRRCGHGDEVVELGDLDVKFGDGPRRVAASTTSSAVASYSAAS